MTMEFLFTGFLTIAAIIMKFAQRSTHLLTCRVRVYKPPTNKILKIHNSKKNLKSNIIKAKLYFCNFTNVKIKSLFHMHCAQQKL